MTPTRLAFLMLTFAVSTAALTVFFGSVVFDRPLLGIGPAIAVSAGVTAAVYFAGAEKHRR